MVHLKSGWNLVGSNTSSFDPNTKIATAKAIWTYRDNNWYATSPDTTLSQALMEINASKLDAISYGEGFWVDMPQDGDIKFEDIALARELSEKIVLSKGWNLLSLKTSSDINISSYFDNENIDIVWKYNNHQWFAYSGNKSIENAIDEANISKIDKLKIHEGFWVLSKSDMEINISPTNKKDSNNTVLVPLYSHPPSIAWDKLFLFNHLTQKRVIVIMNPSNGDFTYQSPSYKKVLGQLKKNHIFTVGYLYTSHGDRNITDVEKNIDSYRKYYPSVDGYFFDEMNKHIEKLDYYKELVKYANKYSILNAGTKIDQKYIDEKFIDLVLDYEGYYDRRRGFNSGNEKTKMAVIYYDAPADAEVPKDIHCQYIDNDKNNSNFTIYLTPKSWQLYSILAHNAKLQYPDSNTSYIFPDDLEQLPKSVQFFMNKKLMQMKICSNNSERNEFRFLNEFNTSNTKNSLELNVSLAGNNDVTFMQIQSKPNYVPLLRISYKDNMLWGHIKENNNTTTKVNLGAYHSGQVIKEEVDNGRLNIYIDNVNKYSHDISYWGNKSFFKFGLYPQTAGCDELNVTNIVTTMH